VNARVKKSKRLDLKSEMCKVGKLIEGMIGRFVVLWDGMGWNGMVFACLFVWLVGCLWFVVENFLSPVQVDSMEAMSFNLDRRISAPLFRMRARSRGWSSDHTPLLNALSAASTARCFIFYLFHFLQHIVRL
jgi:hypothetical protein